MHLDGRFTTLTRLRRTIAGDIARTVSGRDMSGKTEMKMMLRCALAVVVMAMTVPSWSVRAAPHRADAVKTFDTDNDETLDLQEVKKAAAAEFAKLDRDHEGTLDAHELRGRLSAKDLKAADPDHDGTLTMDEYLAIVAQRFDAANADHDGTLDVKELATPAGRKLLLLLR
jgi:hypothetical protein